MQEKVTTDVLVVGGGGAGLTASMLLSRMGVDHLLVSALPTTSILPKAHVLGQRAMEVLDDCGVADAIYAVGTPPEQLRRTMFYAGFAGHPDAGRVLFAQETWGAGGDDPDWVAASPKLTTNLPQIRLEPLMKARAEELAPGRVRFHHELTGLEEIEGGVLASVRDLDEGRPYEVEARYVLGCDGGRTVGKLVGIELQGVMELSRTVTFHLAADLSPLGQGPRRPPALGVVPQHGQIRGAGADGPHALGAARARNGSPTSSTTSTTKGRSTTPQCSRTCACPSASATTRWRSSSSPGGPSAASSPTGSAPAGSSSWGMPRTATRRPAAWAS